MDLGVTVTVEFGYGMVVGQSIVAMWGSGVLTQLNEVMHSPSVT